MRPTTTLLLVLALHSVPAFPANFSFTGTLNQDADTRQFNFSLAQPATVTLRTYSYAGGVNAAGMQIPGGGFDPTLSVFDANGNLFVTNRDGGCPTVASDSVTGFCFDSDISQTFPAGTWQVVLSESENLANGPTLADSFVYAGAGDFTADPGTNNPGFWDFYPNKRTPNFSLDITGADASQTPIASTVGGILNGGSFLGGNAAPNTIVSLFDSQFAADSSTTVTVGGINAQVLYAGAAQINFVIPPTVPMGASVSVEIFHAGALLLSTSIGITDAAPALFTLNASGTGNAAVLNVSPSGQETLNGSVAPGQPAAVGSYIAIFGTGFGVANGPGSDGLSHLTGAVTATIGGVPAQVVFAGLAPQSTMGLQQINVLIPTSAPTGPSVSLILQIGTHSTQTGTTIAIQ